MLKGKKWPKPVAEHFNKELDKLLRINPMAAEYPVAMNYVEFMLDLPWEEYTSDDFDLKRGEENSRPGSLRARESEVTHFRISRRAEVEAGYAWTDSLFIWTSRRW